MEYFEMTQAPPIFPLSSDPGSATVSFDEIIKTQFERCRQAGILRNDPLESNVQRRRLPGKLGLIAEYEPTLFEKKRPAALPGVVSMNEPFNPSKFNFNKVDQDEVLLYVQSGEEVQPILANVSPLMYGHGLLTPWTKEGLPQKLIPKAISLAIQLLLAAPESEFCIGFNSLGAFSSVNHLHLHILYPGELDHEARLKGQDPLMNGGNDFPIARAAIQRTVTENYGGCRVDLIDWKVPCFSFRQHALTEDIFTDLGAPVSRFIVFLQEHEIPHNVLFLQDPSCRIRVLIVPRKPQQHFDSSLHGFNAALGEISGMLIAKTKQHLVAFEEAHVCEVMAEFVACEQSVLSEILSELTG